MHHVGHLIAGAGCGNAQVLQQGALPQVQVHMQVLGQAVLALRRVAVVAFDQHAAHAIGHLHHEHGGLHGTAGLVAQVQPHRFPGVLAGRCAHTQAQALAAQGAVRPGEGGGITAPGLCQSAEQLCALLGIAGVQPARGDAALQRVAHGVQGPAGAGQGGCVAAVGTFFCTFSEPDASGRRWQVAKRLVARGNPAARGQVFPGRQCIGFGGVHGSGLRQFGDAGETGFGDAACQVQPPCFGNAALVQP